MQYRQLGTTGQMVSAISLGCMGMSDGYGLPRLEDRAWSIATIHAALDAGVNLLDTGDFYSSGHNEMLVGEALRGHRREQVILTVKFSVQHDPNGGLNGFDNRPACDTRVGRDRLGRRAGQRYHSADRARSRSRLTEALGSVDLELTPSDISRLSAAIPNDAAAGDACPAYQRRAGADDATSSNTEKVTIRSPN